MKVKIDKFITAIGLAVLLAYVFPGGASGPLPLNSLISWGVSLIFFFYGLKLSLKELVHGLKNWKLHLLIQLTTFLVFPVLILPFQFLATTTSQHTIWLGFLFLAALPSTVSSSVVMVAMARGNLPAAIFNASISGLIGILLTPFWMSFYVSSAVADFDLTATYWKLLTEIVLPIGAGIALQPYLGHFARKFSKPLATFDKSIIWLVIYKSFAHSFEQNLFHTVGLTDFMLLGASVIGLFFLIYNFTGWAARQLHFSAEDQITARFCGTKKSLVHGTVFSKILFSTAQPLGLILLPLLVFHALQLVIISFKAIALSKR